MEDLQTFIKRVANQLSMHQNTFTMNDIEYELQAKNRVYSKGWVAQVLNNAHYTFDRYRKVWKYDYSKEPKKSIPPNFSTENNRLKQKVDYLKRELDNARTANSSLVERLTSLEKTHTDLITEYEKIKHVQIHTEDELTNLAAWVRQFKNKLNSYDSVLTYIHSRICNILIYKKDENSVEKQIKDSTEAHDLVGEVIGSLLNDDYCSRCKIKLLCKSYNTAEAAIFRVLGRFELCPARDVLVQKFIELDKILNKR